MVENNNSFIMLADLEGLEFGQGTMGWLVLVPDIWVLVGPQLCDSSSCSPEYQHPRWPPHPRVQPLGWDDWEAGLSWCCWPEHQACSPAWRSQCSRTPSIVAGLPHSTHSGKARWKLLGLFQASLGSHAASLELHFLGYKQTMSPTRCKGWELEPTS